MWSDDDWLKKFSGKTLEENKEEEGSEPPKVETQEVSRRHAPPRGGLALSIREFFFFKFLWKFAKHIFKTY